jgi:hypothetical protein
MLKITSEGRKAALDLRVLNPRAKDHRNNKVNLAADTVFQIWKETAWACLEKTDSKIRVI